MSIKRNGKEIKSGNKVVSPVLSPEAKARKKVVKKLLKNPEEITIEKLDAVLSNNADHIFAKKTIGDRMKEFAGNFGKIFAKK